MTSRLGVDSEAGRATLLGNPEGGLSVHAAIAEKKGRLAEVCRRCGVMRLEVFGSAARGADFDPATSDADFLVEFDPESDLPPLEQFFGLVDALSDALGRSVDLVEKHAFRNPYLAASINASRELVYEV